MSDKSDEQKVFKTFSSDVQREVRRRLKKAGSDYSGGLNEVWHLMGDKRPVYDAKSINHTVRVDATYEVGGQTFTAKTAAKGKSRARSLAALKMMIDLGIYKTPETQAKSQAA